MSVNLALNRYTDGEMTKAERTLLCAVADLMLMMEPRGYVEGTDIGKARARLERARVSLEAEGLMGRVTLTPEAAGEISQMIRKEREAIAHTEVRHGTD